MPMRGRNGCRIVRTDRKRRINRRAAARAIRARHYRPELLCFGRPRQRSTAPNRIARRECLRRETRASYSLIVENSRLLACHSGQSTRASKRPEVALGDGLRMRNEVSCGVYREFVAGCGPSV